jgi:hypothetical protein
MAARSFLLYLVALAPNGLAFAPRSLTERVLHRAQQQPREASFLDSVQTALNQAFSKPLPNLPGIAGSSLAAKTEALLAAVDEALRLGTPAAEEAVRVQFASIEASAPAPTNLLGVPSQAAALAGVWRLRYTVAAFGAPGSGGEPAEGSQPQQRRGVQGSVNATGIKVDTTGVGVVTTQTFDLAASRVANDIVTPSGPLGFEVRLQVAGPFQRR